MGFFLCSYHVTADLIIIFLCALCDLSCGFFSFSSSCNARSQIRKFHIWIDGSSLVLCVNHICLPKIFEGLYLYQQVHEKQIMNHKAMHLNLKGIMMNLALLEIEHGF